MYISFSPPDVATFWSFNAGNVIATIAVVIAYLAYRLDTKKEALSRRKTLDELIKEQAEMHSDNRNRLEQLAEFHRQQMIVNQKRDEQISELKTQTATLTQIAKGIDRRLELLEERRQP